MGFARAEPGVDPRGAEEAHEVASDTGGGHDARRRRHRGFERLLGVGAATNVEQDGGAVLPWRLVLADHQVAEAGRARPVNVAQVVAHHVLAQAVELVALARERVLNRAAVGITLTAPFGRAR